MNEGEAASCPETGLAVPECSCRRCLERMVREFRPELLAGEIKVTRLAGRRRARRPSPRRRRAA